MSVVNFFISTLKLTLHLQAHMWLAWSCLQAQCGYVFLQNCYIRTSILVGNDDKLSTTTPDKQNLAKDDLRGIDKANPTKRHPKNERRIECVVMLLHINGICVYSNSAQNIFTCIMCVCLCLSLVHVCVCMHVFVHVHVSAYVCVCLCLRVCVCVYLCDTVHVYTSASIIFQLTLILLHICRPPGGF